MRFIPHPCRSIELRGCDWAPQKAAENGRPCVCRNAAGNVFLATKRDRFWFDFDGLERDVVDFVLGVY